MSDLNLNYTKALVANGKKPKTHKLLTVIADEMLLADEALGSPILNKTMEYLDDTPDPETKLTYNGSGCLEFAKAAIVIEWKRAYPALLKGVNVSDYAFWQVLNKKLGPKHANLLSRGKLAPHVKRLIAEAKRAR
jgi:hypothetical protein